jgi:hypothetical protein
VADKADLTVSLGERNRRFAMELTLRSSQGGHHSFRLPPGAEIQSLDVNGQAQPFSSAQADSGPEVTFPLRPGTLNVSLTWLSSEPLGTLFKSPTLNFGLPLANLNFRVNVPEDRFVILTGGPIQGPAVLFWSMAGALLIVSFVLARLKITPLGAVSWFLLFIGLTQLSVAAAALVAGWLLALGLRNRGAAKSVTLFNLAQIGLAIWTVAALNLIYQGLKRGLLEAPAMRVVGNGSRDTILLWFQDRSDGLWPSAWSLTLTHSFYHYVMLAWALWLAISIIRWLVWGWKSFSRDALWKKFPPRPKAGPRTGPSPQGDGSAAPTAAPAGEPTAANEEPPAGIPPAPEPQA